MSTAAPATVVLDPSVCGRRVASSDRSRLPSVLGGDLADIGTAPRLLAVAALNEIRAHADGRPPAFEVFTGAAELFATATLDGESPQEYARRVCHATGLTATAVDQAVADLTAELRALPATTAAELPATGFGDGFDTRWVPRGRVFAAVMASNHPVPNISWAQALFHGYSVLVKPGSRDPFTPARLLAALTAAGLEPSRAAFLPCSREVGEYLLREADRGIIYGGESAVSTWHQRESVAVRGPGRTKALLDTAADDDVIEHLALSASFDGGTRCTNLSAVLTTGAVEEVADRLAERLAKLPSLPATDGAATLLVVNRARAEALREQVATLRASLTDHSARAGEYETVVELVDGSFLLRPVVLSADRAGHPAVGTELPFPFVVVAPWTEADGVEPLRDSLVLNLLTDREELVEAAVREPSVRKVTRGRVLPWTATPGIPHDDNYTQFLLEPKGLVAQR
ncbi:aldehyde dehydrogenase family protein [Streptomyces cyaneofuscatus]|uniref:aldehyde dehydrogenase family protein n=1 Tax=Streptomyces TaxID=1883 RepID=UPI000978F86B|nr:MULTISPECIES: aldehyde dehydrogenase family protein [unclassified Streptomyces]ONI51706.1 1-pyrroline-5-carboxylate dehydrogenase [Streptomyces sp. IB2014 011-1]RDV49853.1 arylcarboxylate reductase [Streptomyces sp. IB2014 011-12]